MHGLLLFLQPDQSFCWRGGGLHGRVGIVGLAPDSYCAGNGVAAQSMVWIFAGSFSGSALWAHIYHNMVCRNKAPACSWWQISLCSRVFVNVQTSSEFNVCVRCGAVTCKTCVCLYHTVLNTQHNVFRKSNAQLCFLTCAEMYQHLISKH